MKLFFGLVDLVLLLIVLYYCFGFIYSSFGKISEAWKILFEVNQPIISGYLRENEKNISCYDGNKEYYNELMQAISYLPIDNILSHGLRSEMKRELISVTMHMFSLHGEYEILFSESVESPHYFSLDQKTVIGNFSHNLFSGASSGLVSVFIELSIMGMKIIAGVVLFTIHMFWAKPLMLRGVARIISFMLRFELNHSREIIAIETVKIPSKVLKKLKLGRRIW